VVAKSLSPVYNEVPEVMQYLFCGIGSFAGGDMILIIGATGTVGSELVRQLAARSTPVRALVRNPEKAASLTRLGVETVLGDLEQPSILDAALDGIRRAFLLSPIHPRQIELQGNFVEAAKRAGTVHIVKLSGLGTALDSSVRSGRWHAQTEKQIADAGLPFTFLRPLFFMHNILRFAPSIQTKGVFVSAMQTGKVAMIDVSDVAVVAVATLTTDGHEGKSYTLTGPEALSFLDVAERISAVIGTSVSYQDVPPAVMRKQLLDAGMPEWLVDVRMDFNATLSAGGASTVTDVVRMVTGKPPRTFAHFVREHASLFKRA
jgi:uncharacterized protein YbjT (DUF2867 family)